MTDPIAFNPFRDNVVQDAWQSPPMWRKSTMTYSGRVSSGSSPPREVGRTRF